MRNINFLRLIYTDYFVSLNVAEARIKEREEESAESEYRVTSEPPWRDPANFVPHPTRGLICMHRYINFCWDERIDVPIPGAADLCSTSKRAIRARA